MLSSFPEGAQAMAARQSRESRAVPQFESLEPRLLLSGTIYIVDSLADAVGPDGVVTLREAIEAGRFDEFASDFYAKYRG